MKRDFTLAGLFWALLATAFAFSQAENPVPGKPKKQIDLGFDGMIGLSYGSETWGINVGGPSLKLRINKFKIGIGAFPSLIIADQKAMPRLAVSPIVEYRNIMLLTPYYGYDSQDEQIWTFGAGYKFF